MTSVGEILRSAREGQGRTAAEIAEELCITQRYLNALEKDDLNSLPGTFFYKSFARQYAALLGIPDKVILPALQAAVSPAPEQAETETSRPPIRAPEPLLEASNTRFGDHRLGTPVGMLVLVVAVCSGIYAWWSRPAVYHAPAVAQVTPAPAVPAPAVATPVAEITSAVPGTGDDPNHVVLNLSATEDTWIRITSDGKEIFSGLLRPSQTKTLDATDMAKLKVGNAGGLEVRLNGKEIGPLGARGEVREVLFTAPDNYQILSPDGEPAPDTSL